MIILDNTKVELAKSDRSRCYSCGKKIGKDLPRISRLTSSPNPNWTRFLCHKCGGVILNSDIRRLKRTITHRKRLKTRLKRQIIKKDKEIKIHELFLNL